MKIAVIASVVLLAANVAVAQIQTCSVVSPAKAAQFDKLGINAVSAMTQYMTATDLINAESKAFQCEFPPREMIRDLDNSIAWRVTKFAQAQGEKYTRMLVEYGASAGSNTLTATVAIKWLKHNNLIVRFNAWDAADVRHSFEEKRKEAREEAASKAQQEKAEVSRANAAQSTAIAQIPSDTSQGLLIKNIPPAYPSLARQARIQGSVILRTVVGKDGTVQTVDLVSGHPMLVPAAIEAVRQWRYRPYTVNGAAVAVETQAVVNFSLATDPQASAIRADSSTSGVRANNTTNAHIQDASQSSAVIPAELQLSQSIKLGDVRFSFPEDWVKTQTSSQTDATPDRTELRPQPQQGRWLGYGVNFSFMRVPPETDTSKVDVGAALGMVFQSATNTRAGMKALGEQVRFSMNGRPAAMQAYQDTTAQSGEFGVMIALVTPHGLAFWRTFSPSSQKDVEMALVKSILNTVSLE